MAKQDRGKYLSMLRTLHAVAHHLDTFSGPSTETNLLSHQSICLRTADDVLVYPARPFGTSCRIISEIPLYLSTTFSALSKELLIFE